MTATTRRDGKRDAQRGVSIRAYVSRVCASARWTPDEMLPRFDHGYHWHEPYYHHDNDEKQASVTIMLMSIMSVIVTGLIVAAVLSTRACSVVSAA